MNHLLSVAIVHHIKKLSGEVAARVFTHGAHGLAQIKKETASDELHDDEDQVVDDAAGGLYDLAWVAEVKHVDDAWVLEVLQDCNLILHWKDWVFVAAQELFFQDLNRNDFRLVVDVASEVHLGSVAFACGFDNFVFAIENGMCLCLFCHFM